MRRLSWRVEARDAKPNAVLIKGRGVWLYFVANPPRDRDPSSASLPPKAAFESCSWMSSLRLNLDFTASYHCISNRATACSTPA